MWKSNHIPFVRLILNGINFQYSNILNGYTVSHVLTWGLEPVFGIAKSGEKSLRRGVLNKNLMTSDQRSTISMYKQNRNWLAVTAMHDICIAIFAFRCPYDAKMTYMLSHYGSR